MMRYEKKLQLASHFSFDRCEQLQTQRERLRSATLFPWWLRRIKKRQGPRRT